MAVIFHVAFPMKNIEETKWFYVEGLGCALGRESKVALTLNLQGHQIVAQMTSQSVEKPRSIYPRHFGLVFTSKGEWQAMVDRAKEKKLSFFKEPSTRFLGSPLEHHTFFLEDPAHNLLEFKHYTKKSAIFGEREFGDVGDADEPR
ncbi:MAG: glyoxalase [Nitrospirales bacterium]|nr:MAG: glyoxalase [Nitrospirales bacterium]